jgi:hypothetical protein
MACSAGTRSQSLSSLSPSGFKKGLRGRTAFGGAGGNRLFTPPGVRIRENQCVVALTAGQKAAVLSQSAQTGIIQSRRDDSPAPDKPIERLRPFARWRGRPSPEAARHSVRRLERRRRRPECPRRALWIRQSHRSGPIRLCAKATSFVRPIQSAPGFSQGKRNYGGSPLGRGAHPSSSPSRQERGTAVELPSNRRGTPTATVSPGYCTDALDNFKKRPLRALQKRLLPE